MRVSCHHNFSKHNSQHREQRVNKTHHRQCQNSQSAVTSSFRDRMPYATQIHNTYSGIVSKPFLILCNCRSSTVRYRTVLHNCIAMFALSFIAKASPRPIVVGAFASISAFASPKISCTNHRHLSSTLQSSDVDGIAAPTSFLELKEFYDSLLSSGRDINAASVQIALDQLIQTYTTDARTTTTPSFDGDWQMKTVPNFPGIRGHNEEGESLYTMGRLTYNMIKPGNMIVSMQKVTQHVHKLSIDPAHLDSEGAVILPPFIPKSLRGEVEEDASELRSYRTDVHFTLEDNGIKGVLQMDGYTLPNPSEDNRYTIWFTGGRCYALNGQDAKQWRDVFGTELPKLKMLERFKLWMAKMFMGAEPSEGMLEDGSLTYLLKKPIGGHKTAYQQVIYLDDDTRITRGNRGTIVAVARM
jgi:hypothetical protein